MSYAETAIARLSAVFGEPRTENPELFVAEFARAIARCDGQLLERAIDEVIKGCTFWPKPAEVLQMVARGAADREASERRKFVPVDQDIPPPSPDAIARVNALIQEAKAAISAERPIEEREIEPADRTVFDGRTNRYLKTKWVVPDRAESLTGTLTERSKRMSGERD